MVKIRKSNEILNDAPTTSLCIEKENSTKKFWTPASYSGCFNAFKLGAVEEPTWTGSWDWTKSYSRYNQEG